MDAETFIKSVRDDNETELSRLGSSKSLYADTEGQLEANEVLSAAATAEYHAAETYREWADSETGETKAAFAETAREEKEHYETVLGQLEGHEPGEVPAIQSYLRELDGTIERLGGFIGRTLAAEKSKTQVTGFFVGNADPQTAQLFRAMGDDLDAQLARASERIEAECENDGDWELAHNAANGAINAAYDEYTNRLESMGVNPKPVC